MGNCDAEIDYEINRVIDQILREDRLESMGLNPCSDSCETRCEGTTDEPYKNCAIETSARFSIRILEALRGVQREKANHTWPSSTMEEIVQYITRHYNYDGDLCSQVETALDQVTAQGFVVKMGMNRYHLVGPFAYSVPKPSAYKSCNRNRRTCTRQSKSLRDRKRGGSSSRRRSACTPNANSTLAECDNPADFSLDRLTAISDMEDHDSAEIQNRNNQERSLIHREEMDPFVPRLAGGLEGNDNNFNGNLSELYPPAPHERIRRPGGRGGHGRIVRDGNIDENIEEIYRPFENNPMQMRGDCNNCEEMIVDRYNNSDENIDQIANTIIERPVVQVHSSDDNMYRIEEGNNNQGRRPRCQYPVARKGRRRRTSHSSSDSINSRCSAPRKSRQNSNSSSDADISDDADLDEIANAKPWVRNCQNQNKQTSSRRGQECSSCVLDD